MIPAEFEYRRAGSVDEAIALLSEHGEDAKLLAGGHSLLPAMKLRLAQPKIVVDVGRVVELTSIREEGGRLVIGALATHHQIEASELLREKCPLFPEVAASIGDVQVRNKGTLGGSLVHADPAADWPGAILALDAEIEIAGPSGRRTIHAGEFFVDMLQTAVQPNEILTAVRVGETGKSTAYVKSAQKASGFSLAGAAVVLGGSRSAVAITGVGPKPYRASGVEEVLDGGPITVESIERAAERAADGADALGDIHASAEFRAHLACVMTRRALESAVSRA